MRSIRFHIFLSVVALIIFLTGCISSNHSIPSPVPMTMTMKIIPTDIILTTIPTPTVLPTLSAEEAYARLHELLKNDLDCQLPCWFGIKPGRSMFLDMKVQLTLFTSIASDTRIETPITSDKRSWEYLNIPFPSDNMVIEIVSSFLTKLKDNKVSEIGVKTRSYKQIEGNYEGDVYGYPVYIDFFEAYDLSEILSTYGLPDNVFIEAYLRDMPIDQSPIFADNFRIHLWYTEKGIIVIYKMDIQGSGENYRFCPANAFIQFTLISPVSSVGDKDTYETSQTKTTEEAIGMTIKDFYNLFLTTTNHCLETPKSIWWPKH